MKMGGVKTFSSGFNFNIKRLAVSFQDLIE
jgi:hypothetical protein